MGHQKAQGVVLDMWSEEADVSYWLENRLPSEWTPIGDRGTEYRFIQHIPGGWLGCLRQFVGRYGKWSEMTVMTVRPGMSEDYIRTLLFEAVYEFEKAYP